MKGTGRTMYLIILLILLILLIVLFVLAGDKLIERIFLKGVG